MKEKLPPYGRLIFLTSKGADGPVYSLSKKRYTFGTSDKCHFRLSAPEITDGYGPNFAAIEQDESGHFVYIKNCNGVVSHKDTSISPGANAVIEHGDIICFFKKYCLRFELVGKINSWQAEATSMVHSRVQLDTVPTPLPPQTITKITNRYIAEDSDTTKVKIKKEEVSDDEEDHVIINQKYKSKITRQLSQEEEEEEEEEEELPRRGSKKPLETVKTPKKTTLRNSTRREPVVRTSSRRRK